jgi:hypothetical protein
MKIKVAPFPALVPLSGTILLKALTGKMCETYFWKFYFMLATILKYHSI